MNLLTEEIQQTLEANKVELIEDEVLKKDGLFHVKVEFSYLKDLTKESETVEFILKPNRLNDSSDDHIELILDHDSLEIAYEVLMLPDVYHEVIRQIEESGYKEPVKKVADIKPEPQEEVVEEGVTKDKIKKLAAKAMIKYKEALDKLKDA